MCLVLCLSGLRFRSGEGAEDVALVEAVLDHVADRQADARTDVARLRRSEDVVEAEFHAPEDRRRDEAHRHVKREHGRVVTRVLRLEAEDPFLVEHVFHDETDAGADEYREQDVPRARVEARGEVLRADVGGSGDGGEEGVEKGGCIYLKPG